MPRKLAFFAVLVLTGLALAAPAGAAVTCSYSAAQARVTATMNGTLETLTISRAGNKIQAVGGAISGQCGAATVKNTNAIYVTSTGGNQQTLVIALGGGAFAPGKKKEKSGISEIEFVVNLGTSTDALIIDGGDKAENIRFGSQGVNLNNDGDSDLKPTSVENWEVEGSGGADVISGAGGKGTGGTFGRVLTVTGDAGNDTIVGGARADTLQGGGGRDHLVGGAGADRLFGLAAADRLEGGPGPDTFIPGLGNDTVLGGPGGDFVYSEVTKDGSDDFHGGPDADFILYYQRAGTVKVSLDNKRNDGATNEKDNIHSDVEGMYGGAGNDKLVGSNGPNTIDGGAGNDVIEGRGSQDSLSGGSGATSGNDTLRGQAGDDYLVGGDGNDTLEGGDGEDTHYGGNGIDTVRGGAGDDWVYEDSATNGADSLSGGSGDMDRVSYASRGLGVGVSLDGTANDGQGGEGDNVGSDFEWVYGSSVGDLFLGNALDNIFSGGGGPDVATGGDGADTFYGGPGTDTLTGGDGSDQLNGDDDNDTLNANDGGYDIVNGGAGAGDTCVTDVGVDSVTNCP